MRSVRRQTLPPEEIQAVLQVYAMKTFLTITEAAKEAGYSLRHMRRILEEEHVPVVKIGRKFFLQRSTFEERFREIAAQAKRRAS